MSAAIPNISGVRIGKVTPKTGFQPIKGGMQAAFLRGDKGLTVGGWKPVLRDTRDDVRIAWTQAAARAVDMIQNSGFIAGIIDQSVTNVVGTGLRLKARPDTDALGMTAGEAQEWARTVERRFQLWSRNPIECDAEGRKSFGHLQASAYRHWLAMGEIFALLPWKRRAGGRYGTKVLLIPAYKVSSETIGETQIQGVVIDEFSAAIAYIFKEKSTNGFEKDRRIAARDRFGRLIVVHSFDGMPGQVRGITLIAPVLNVTKQFDQLSNSTLTSAIIQAVFAATVESNAPTKDLLDALQSPQERARGTSSDLDAYFDAREGWYDNTHLDLGVAGRFAHLFPNEKLAFHETKQQGANYETFANMLLREIARCIGITYESATGNYSDASYSSINMATADIHEVTLYRRKNILAPFCQAAYEAWLEEEIESGGIAFPGGIDGFVANRAGACRAEWKGPGKPQADQLKSARAWEILKKLGVVTDEMIADENGSDIEDIYEVRAREKAMRAEYGLPETSEMIGHNGGPSIGDDDGEEDDDDEQEDEGDDEPSSQAMMATAIADLAASIRQTPQTINVNVEAPHVTMGETKVDVHAHIPKRGPVEKTVTAYDEKGRIVGMIEKEADE